LRALSTGRALRVAIAPEVGSVWVDPLMLERVVANLAENALKFAPAPAEVRVLARRAGGALELTVEDDGPGLPAGREHTLFAAFERGAATAAQPGVGLGLAICRLVMEAHGGTLVAGRAGSGGASFRLTLPQDGPPPAPEPEALA